MADPTQVKNFWPGHITTRVIKIKYKNLLEDGKPLKRNPKIQFNHSNLKVRAYFSNKVFQYVKVINILPLWCGRYFDKTNSIKLWKESSVRSNFSMDISIFQFHSSFEGGYMTSEFNLSGKRGTILALDSFKANFTHKLILKRLLFFNLLLTRQ